MKSRTFGFTFILLMLSLFLSGCGLVSVLTGKDNPEGSQAPTPSPQANTSNPQPSSPATQSSSSPLSSPTFKAGDFSITLPAVTYEQKLIVPGRVGVSNQLFIDGKSYAVNKDGTFRAELELTPGENTLYFKVLAPNNSVYATGRKVIYKLKPPLTLSSLPNTYTSESPTFVVKGTTGPNFQVEVNGIKSESDNNGNFMVSVPLTEGENILNVTSTNQDGVKSTFQASLTYAKPEKEPLLVVTSPEEDGFVSAEVIKLTGFTDPNNLIEVYNNYFVEDKKVKSLIFSGTVKDESFAINATLSEGKNELLIRAVDPQGKAKEVTRNVTYKKTSEAESSNPDKEAPVIEFFQASPLKGSRNKSSTSNNELKIIVKATDNDSGVAQIIVEYYNPEKTELIPIELDFDRSLNAWTGSYEFDSKDDPGDYTLNTIYAYDRDDNWKPYTASDLKSSAGTTFTLQ